MPLRVRWLGRVHYRDAHAVQHGMWERSGDDHLLLLEHPHVYTLGVRAKREHVLVDPVSVGAELIETDRGGDVTYHGPGQLVGYPILTVPMGPDAVPNYVHGVEQLVIDALEELGLPGAGRLPDYPGVWVGDRKICAIGVRVTRGRSMHGFALNVDPDMRFFEHIVPCGIRDKAVTSMAGEGVDAPMEKVVDVVARLAADRWGRGDAERQDVAWERTFPSADALPLISRKPGWVRVKAEMGAEFRQLKQTMRSLELVTVCEEAGCPNIFECWRDGTATFMINGERCTRACGFCLVDTSQPLPIDHSEPDRVARAVEQMGLKHAVVTAVARDDVPDGGAGAFAATIEAIRRRCPDTAVEVLIPDCKGDPESLAAVFAARPDVLNHNLETVARLQRMVRPSASYARSLAVLARAKAAGLTTKSGVMVGLGETEDEVVAALSDLRAVGVDIVTIGQYLRPSAAHLPVDRWWTPDEFERLRLAGEAMGFSHVQSSPLTRSSYHARQSAAAAHA
ncbi:MAG: lipoyl synthase [Actinobacteria bacterium]|nr:lipoyl synthase [Actinomycetota bacterium]